MLSDIVWQEIACIGILIRILFLTYDREISILNIEGDIQGRQLLVDEIYSSQKR